MDILPIENDARRRIAAADRLAMAGHRVTLSSSMRETREILRFVEDDADAPEAVVIAEALEMADRTRFHEEMADRFPDACWIPFRPDLGLDWLQDWLDRTTGRTAALASNVIRFPVERGRYGI